MNHHVTVNEPRIGTNHSSHAERSLCNKFAFLVISKKTHRCLCAYKSKLKLLLGVFVCVTLISVKSKYGSRSGSCAGSIGL